MTYYRLITQAVRKAVGRCPNTFGTQRSDVEGSNANSALEEVEPERKVAFEIEEEREVERPRVMNALKFPGLNDDIRRFLETGLVSGTTGYMAASAMLTIILAVVHHPE